jgi:hypothetical protein
MPDNNQTNYTPTLQAQAQTASPEMLAALREYSSELNKSQQKPVGAFYSPWQGLADMSAKIMAGVMARRADIMQAAQNHQDAMDALKHLPGANKITDPTAAAYTHQPFNPYGLLSGAPPSDNTGGQ